MTPERIAVILFNLGGPDRPEAVEPFLFNLFSDKAIISLPQPLRYLLAKFISSRRTPYAQKIYAQMGGKSPQLEWTKKQAAELGAALNTPFQRENSIYQTFVSMRYWHPRADEVVKKVQDFHPDRLILLPLYPQYSTATTASSLLEWKTTCQRAGLHVPMHAICCYPTAPEFIAAHAALLRSAYDEASLHGPPRILFSAHGLPERTIQRGDPYQWQVEKTVAAIVEALAIPGLDSAICYQSRVGRLKWIGPYTDAEITRAAHDKKSVIVVPVSFVSEHSETLVELDSDYRKLFKQEGGGHYVRVPALGVEKGFIEALKSLCLSNHPPGGILSCQGSRLCPASCSACPCR